MAIKPPVAVGEAPKIPLAPMPLKPAGIVPPAPAAPAVAIKPPGAVAEAPRVSAVPVSPKAPGTLPGVSLSPKKETAKISLPAVTRNVPQATMDLKKPGAKSVAPSGKNISLPTNAQPAAADGKIPSQEQSSQSELILGIAATVVALLSLGIQVWTFLG